MCNSKKNFDLIKFGVFADLHIDIMHDSLLRLKTFLNAAEEQDVDFIVSLGDITYPDRDFMTKETGSVFINRIPKAFQCRRDGEKREAMRMLRSFKKPVYHVLGNHDTDICTTEQALKYLGADRAFYSFDAGRHHFIVLDCNYIRKGGEYIHYHHCNYHECQADEVSYLPDDQLLWLEQDIMASSRPSTIFSHQSLSDTINGVQNRETVWKMFQRVNRDKKRVVLCMNGHSHIDGMTVRDGVCFMDVNSMSNIWLGGQYSCVRYSEEIAREYPYIQNTVPYRDPLYAIVTMSDQRIVIKGTKSEFVGPSPYELGFPKSGSAFISTAVISDHIIQL